MRTVLMIAFHFPPFGEGSGVHRTVKFARYLRDYGWRPLILTTTPAAYAKVRPNLPGDIPPDVEVTRAPAWDIARRLSIRGRYLKWMALPDRWLSWWPPAVAAGLKLIRQFRPQVLWSTYPIATTHLIGLTLHRLTGIPWIADFRDPMTDTDPLSGVEFPLDPAVRRTNGWIERLVVKHCAHAVFTTPGTARLYADRYPQLPSSRWVLIENGYDEADFAEAEHAVLNERQRSGVQKLLVHSGALSPSIRNPCTFFAALAELRRTGQISPSTLRVVLRGSGHDGSYMPQLRAAGLDDIVFFEPGVPYQDALREMLTADGLLVIQDANCNSQIPAKLYEYLRACRPIFGLTDPNGDTGAVLRSEGITSIAPLHDKDKIAMGFTEFLRHLDNGTGTRRAAKARIEKYSRRGRTQALGRLLDSLCDP